MQRRLRLLHHFADHLPVWPSRRLRHHQELPGRLAILAKFIDANRLAISVVRPRRRKLVFLLRKPPDNLIRRQRRRRRSFRLRSQPPHIMFGRRRQRRRRCILRVNSPSAQCPRENGKNKNRARARHPEVPPPCRFYREVLGNPPTTCPRRGRRPCRPPLRKPKDNLSQRIHNSFRCKATAPKPPRLPQRISLPQIRPRHGTSAPRAHSHSVTIYRFVSEPKQARRYFVSGIVQGVGFRYFATHTAERLHRTGYARTLPDRRVEVYAVGAPGQLAKLRDALERGPLGASVSEVAEQHAAVHSNYEFGFVINY